MPKALRWFGLGASVTVPVVLGARRWLAAPRQVAPMELDPGPNEPEREGESPDEGDLEFYDFEFNPPELGEDEAESAPAPAEEAPVEPARVELVSVDLASVEPEPEAQMSNVRRRAGKDRRSGIERRLGELEGLVGRIMRASDKRLGGDRRRQAERRASVAEDLEQELNAA